MTNDDDDDEVSLGDDRLRSLRAVWLAMPEEEPPEGGMSALLAAATMKAKEMSPAPAEPSWFAKLLELFRRPPVLALATVVVLVGGAVLVNRHEGAVKHESSASVNSELAREEREERDDDARRRFEPTSTAPVEMATKGGGPSAGSGAPTGTPAPATTPPTEPADPELQLRAGGGAPKPETKTAPSRKPSNTPPDADAVMEKPAPPAEDLGDNVTAPAPPPPPPPPPADAPAIERPTPSTPKPPTSPTGRVPQQDAKPTAPTLTAEQLLAQCQSAAVRGDCAATRDLAGRIQKADALVYRDKVLRDDRITRCLSHESSTLAH